jgi:hypothetical protein
MLNIIQTRYISESELNQEKNEETINNYSRSTVLMDKIKFFFQEKENTNIFLEIVKGESEISLRIIDSFVTNYSRNNEVIYDIEKDKNCATTEHKNYTGANENKVLKEKFMVHYSYKAQLKAYSKKQFDPFCRRDRILFYIDYDDGSTVHVRTTVGQLNFFRWAIKNKVISYIRNNFEEIEKKINKINEKVKLQKKKKKVKNIELENKESVSSRPLFLDQKKENPVDKKLLLSATKQVSRHDIVIRVQFY